ncbi:MAG: primosomal protein N', partial [Clostridia bacterium]|nr:primosomal protein N' [Clostridia bacterium]
TPKQYACFEVLESSPGLSVKELCERADIGMSVIAGLERKGLVTVIEEKIDRIYGLEDGGEKGQNVPLVLSEDQQNAAGKIRSMLESGKPCAALLHGVTGSGKTKVIISAVKDTLAMGKGAIVLTPEIGLSSQALYQFRNDFGDEVAVIHSMLSDGERRDTYKRIENGEIKVVLGTRSAVFAPMKNVGLIAIDEEQELTYKSERSPKYHARDIARFRCAYHNAVMLLASATPSVESMFRSRAGKYELIELKNRFNGSALPDVSIIDLRNDERASAGKLLSSELSAGLLKIKEKEEQAILYIGRRGHNSYISCRSCGYVYTCPNCSVSLTYHQYCDGGKPRLICHYCGYSEGKPAKCRECGKEHLGYFGYGTQLLQDELEELLGPGSCLRMDADTTAQKYSHEEILNKFRNKEATVLFGTQMVAKGLDFPNVTLVGLVQTDATLYMSDFRSSERTFSLITQLMGRSGRAEKKGTALIQTYSPDHEVIRTGASQDYEKFYEGEIKLRKAVLFPPYCDIAVFSVSSPVENDVIRAVKLLDLELVRMIENNKGNVVFLKYGPCKEGIYKLYGLFRQRIIIKYRDSAKSRSALRDVYSFFLSKLNGEIKLEMDINPAMV